MELLRAGQLGQADDQVWSKVRIAFADALGLEEDEVELGHRIIDELEAESLDFLDIAYKLEVSFDIKIPRGGIENTAKDGMEEGGYELNGVLNEGALVRLTEAMPEIPSEKFTTGLRVSEVPELFIVATFYNLVIRLLDEKNTAA